MSNPGQADRVHFLDLWAAGSDTKRVLEALALHAHAHVGDIIGATGLTLLRAENVLALLEDRHLVTKIVEGAKISWELEPPDRRVSVELESVERDLCDARRQHQELTLQYWASRRASDPYLGVEILQDRTCAEHIRESMLTTATDQVRILDCAPYDTGSGQPDADFPPAEFGADDMLGHPCRKVICEAHAGHPDAQPGIGDEVRVLNELPIRMIIADDERALVTLAPIDVGDRTDLVVRRSALLKALVSTFEILWRSAVPVSTVRRPETVRAQLTEDQSRVLSLLAAGETDDVVARRLGLSRRTVARHCAAIYDCLGVRTRFQAGLQAMNLGLIKQA